MLGCPFLGPLSGLPVFLGARFATGPVRYRGVRAVAAEAQFLGLTPFFLGKEPGALLVLWGLVFQPVVIEQLLPLGFDLGRGWLGTAFRLSGFGSGLLLRFADGGFPWRLSGWGLPGLGAVPAVVLWELECVLKKTSFCRGGARACGVCLSGLWTADIDPASSPWLDDIAVCSTGPVSAAASFLSVSPVEVVSYGGRRDVPEGGFDEEVFEVSGFLCPPGAVQREFHAQEGLGV